MKIYVASSWRNTIQPTVVQRLRDEGHEVYDFKHPTPEDEGFGWKQVYRDPPPWSAALTRQILDHKIAERGFNFDFSAMHCADVIVMVQKCGVSAALELGWAAGAKKHTIVLLADDCEPELMLKMADKICITLDEVVERLLVIQKASS